MTAAETIAALRAKHEAATPGRWERGDRQHIAGVNKRMFGEGRCCYCDRGEPSWVGKGQWNVTHVHEDDNPWWEHGIFAYRPKGSQVVVNDTAEYGYVTEADAHAIVSAHNALPALLKALEDVLAIARRELHDISCRFHSYAAISAATADCNCWKARVEQVIEDALAEVDHG